MLRQVTAMLGTLILDLLPLSFLILMPPMPAAAVAVSCLRPMPGMLPGTKPVGSNPIRTG